MRESIHKYFKVGTLRWMSFPRTDVVESVKRIACDDFFDAIEISKCKDDEEREAVRKLLSISHMTVCYAAQPTLLGGKLNPNARSTWAPQAWLSLPASGARRPKKRIISSS